MSKQFKTLNFSGGITDELRSNQSNVSWYLENLDTGRQQKSVQQVANTNKVDNTKCIIKMAEYNGTIYGYGQNDATNKDVTLYSASVSGGVVTWTALTNGTVTGTLNNMVNPAFVIKNGFIYFDGGNNYICKYEIATNTMTNNWVSISGTYYGGIVAGDGQAYIWTDQTLYLINTASPAVTAQNIEVQLTDKIVDVITYGNYLALICKPSSTSDTGTSRMLLWDYNQADPIEQVDIGYGTVSGGDLLDGMIYCVIAFPNRKGFRIKVYSGGIFQTVYTYSGKPNTSSSIKYAQPASLVKSYSNYLYFLMAGSRPGVTNANGDDVVLVRYGRKDINDSHKISIYKSLETNLGGTGALTSNDFVIVENNAHPSSYDISVYATVYVSANKTDFFYTTSGSNLAYSAQAGVLETPIFTGEDVSTPKNLIAFSTYNAPLTSGQSVVVKYMKDADTSWTTMYTHSTVGEVGKDCITVESTGDNLPSMWGEIRFRIELLGGAELTGYKFKFDEDNDIYGK